MSAAPATICLMSDVNILPYSAQQNLRPPFDDIVNVFIAAQALHRQKFQHCKSWGIAIDYPNPQNTKHFGKWAWEFLRRNEHYGKYALWMRSLPIDLHTRMRAAPEDLLVHLSCIPPGPEHLRTFREYLDWCAATQTKSTVQTPNQVLRLRWSVTFPLLPSEKYGTAEQRGWKPRGTPFFLSSNVVTYRLPPWTQSNASGLSNEIVKFTTAVQQHHVWLQFRLDASIERQILEASAFLDKWQRKYQHLLNASLGETKGAVPQPGVGQPIANQKRPVHDRALHYMLRIYDAVHDPFIESRQLNPILLAGLLKRFTDEQLGLKKAIRVHQTDADFPHLKVTKAQITKWYERACQFIGARGYLQIAAHTKTSPEERERKKKAAAARRHRPKLSAKA